MTQRFLVPRSADEKKLAKRFAKGTVFILDDNKLLSDSLAALLEVEGYVAHPFVSAVKFLDDRILEMPRFPGPRCVISDINMPKMTGLECQTELAKCLDVPLILMSGVKNPDNVVRGFRSGAIDFLTKPIEVDELFEAIQKALALSEASQLGSKKEESLGELRSRLTDRELLVLKLVSQGSLNKQISSDLNMALRTVKLHRQKAMEKLGFRSATELAPLLESGFFDKPSD